jgi:hypothetical protein
MADRRIDDGPMCTYDAIVDSSFGGVPEELIEYILMHLTPHGDLQACALVCRLFYRLANGVVARPCTNTPLQRRCQTSVATIVRTVH